jgi:hypothetical protein
MATPLRDEVTKPPPPAKKRTREAAAARRREVWDLRLAGASFRQIGARFGVSAPQIHRDCRDVLARVVEETKQGAAEWVAMECARLDRLLMGVWKGAINGDVPSAVAALRICESRRRLLGLDAEVPTVVVAATGGEDLSALSVSELSARLARSLDSLRPTPPPTGPPVIDVAVEPVGLPLPAPADDRAARLAAYERELAQRRNGRPH